MNRVTHLSSHCLIDRPTHLLAFRYRHPLVTLLLRAWYRADPKMHFKWPAGLVWSLLGVGRSTKNPNVCTLWGLGWEAGRLSELTVLFADCRNYTSMTRELGTEKVASLMDSFFRSAYDIVVKYDGIVDKFMGDSCMALFNVPVRRDDHVARAIAAALELQHEIGRMNSEQRHGVGLEVGVSISTGFALAGRIGSNHPSDYTAIGEVVNIASRLQEKAEAGQMLVTEDVYQEVQERFPNANRQQYQLKGIDIPVTGYLLR